MNAADPSAPAAGPVVGGVAANVVVGVGGGIAAYKVCELVRLFTESGHDVTVVPTKAALRFVGAATWAALSGKPAHTQVWDDVEQVPHVRLGQRADLVIVAPATADLLARAAHGLADDLLANVLLTARCPVVFAPAMHTEMWLNAATQANVAILRARGCFVLDPGVGRLTGADSGPGRLPEPAELFACARRVLARGNARLPADMAGRRVVVSAGGTREPIDPVRFVGNRASGRQGYALAATAIARGAEVILIAANVTLPDPAGAKVVAVGTALELRAAVLEAAADADVVVMNAAVADFRPVSPSPSKLKKSAGLPETIDLVENPDVLAELGRAKRVGQLLVGFAAETEDVLANGAAKLAAKGADLLVVNQVGERLGFEVAENEATVLRAGDPPVQIGRRSKEELADRVWDLVAERFTRD